MRAPDDHQRGNRGWEGGVDIDDLTLAGLPAPSGKPPALVAAAGSSRSAEVRRAQAQQWVRIDPEPTSATRNSGAGTLFRYLTRCAGRQGCDSRIAEWSSLNSGYPASSIPKFL
jgi:hypothetical protein